MRQDERDLLIKIDVNLSNLIENVRVHVVADAKAFEKAETKIGLLQKIVFMGLGAFGLLQIILRFYH